MKTLYPEIDCLNQSELSVGNHRIYFEESGNLQGIPVIFLHGGPGSGCNPNHRRYFNPEKYRIIIFDQRGCNRSSPQGCIENNTTLDLLDDIESIRKTLEINKWMVFGGSWGATLGLLYAQRVPERILGMVVRGSFLARQCDFDWFAKSGANRIFPDYWQDFVGEIPESERSDLGLAYYNRVVKGDYKTKEKFARLWSQWATRVVTYSLAEISSPDEESTETLINQVNIETHYARNRYFIKENQILDNVGKIPEVPIRIIHGRKDMTCTLEASWSLHKKLPHSEFFIVRDAGHLAGEPAMVDALINATDHMAEILG